MGLRMDQLHNPSVPSASSQPSGYDSSDGGDDYQKLMKLMEEKERLEKELDALGDVLDSHGVNMNTSLTTFDGFPRDDIDVAQIRTTRTRIIRLRNDHKASMLKCEEGLHAFHALLRDAGPETMAKFQPEATASRPGRPSGSEISQVPFAKVSTVVPESPADEAGLKIGDRIRSFGDLNWRNHEKLSKIAELVRKSEGQSITVDVLREQSGNSQPEELQLQLRPRRNWGGPGLLGCHLLPT